MAEGLILYTCSIDRGGPKLHPCRKAHYALAETGNIAKWAAMGNAAR